VSTDHVRIQFGKEVRAWRGRLGISQEELAERAGLHRTYISDIERGARNVSLANIERLARALEIPVSTLFTAKGDQSAPANEQLAVGQLVDILYIEDNPDDIELTLRALKGANIPNRIHVVRDGVVALDFLFCTGEYNNRQRSNQPEMVLLDLNLPKIGGVEVLRRLKSNPNTRDIPVVILTVSRRHPDIVVCKQLGAEAYITKPVDLQSLGDVAQQLCMQWALIKNKAGATT
jgi:CheY-like chemotaxis protein/DNA-binding XRE family transcriptional regulator